MNELLQAFQHDIDKRNQARFEVSVLETEILKCRMEFMQRMTQLYALLDSAKHRSEEWDRKIEIAEDFRKRMR